MTLNRITLAAMLAVAFGPAGAAVSADEAAKLKAELTPFGAEKAGNKDGSIPAWSGGHTTPIAAGWVRRGAHRVVGDRLSLPARPHRGPPHDRSCNRGDGRS